MKVLELHGKGYKASINGNNLILSLGKSHEDVYNIPDVVNLELPNQTIINITGPKDKVGQVAADIRNFRKPNSYTGNGIRYSDEVVKLKIVKK